MDTRENPEAINFKNLHEIVQDAASETKLPGNESLIVTTFKQSASVKSEVKRVCKSNGTTPSAFYRNCAKNLVKEYTE